MSLNKSKNTKTERRKFLANIGAGAAIMASPFTSSNIHANPSFSSASCYPGDRKKAGVLGLLTGSPPQALPFLEPNYWKAFPNMQTSNLARFLALAKKGRPFTGNMMISRDRDQPPI